MRENTSNFPLILLLGGLSACVPVEEAGDTTVDAIEETVKLRTDYRDALQALAELHDYQDPFGWEVSTMMSKSFSIQDCFIANGNMGYSLQDDAFVVEKFGIRGTYFGATRTFDCTDLKNKIALHPEEIGDVFDLDDGAVVEAFPLHLLAHELGHAVQHIQGGRMNITHHAIGDQPLAADVLQAVTRPVDRQISLESDYLKQVTELADHYTTSQEKIGFLKGRLIDSQSAPTVADADTWAEAQTDVLYSSYETQMDDIGLVPLSKDVFQVWVRDQLAPAVCEARVVFLEAEATSLGWTDPLFVDDRGEPVNPCS